MPSSDAEVLGSLANDEWLTITATSNTTIDLTTWSGSSWGTNTVKTVEQGYIFTWTLPYNLSGITCNNGTIELPINQNALNLQNNTDDLYDEVITPSLTIPFGLAIGTISNPISVSSTWGSSVVTQYDGYICTNFGTGQDAFSLPNPWIVSWNNQNTSSNNSEQSPKQQTTPKMPTRSFLPCAKNGVWVGACCCFQVFVLLRFVKKCCSYCVLFYGVQAAWILKTCT